MNNKIGERILQFGREWRQQWSNSPGCFDDENEEDNYTVRRGHQDRQDNRHPFPQFQAVPECTQNGRMGSRVRNAVTATPADPRAKQGRSRWL